MTRPDLSEYTVVLASAEQAEIQDRYTMIPWGRGLNFEDFSYVFTKPNMMTWVLVKRDDLRGEVYAGCESYLRQALIKQRDGTLKDGWVYNIEAVTTSPQHRGNGYATHLLRLLHYNLGSTVPPFPKSWGAPPPLPPVRLEKAAAATLWTDVGEKFYANCTVGDSLPGYLVDRSRAWHMHFDLKPALEGVTTLTQEGAKERGWSWIYEEDLPEVQKLFCAEVRHRLELDTVSSGVLTLPLTEVFIDNMPVIGRRYDETVTGKPWTEPVPYGVKIDDSIILFTLVHVALEPGLLITRAHNLGPDQLSRALEAMDVAGARMGHKHAVAWGTEAVLRQWEGGEREVKVDKRPEMMGHLPATVKYEDVEEVDDWQMWLWG